MTDTTSTTQDLKPSEVEHDAIHKHFSLTYANYLVLPRTLLQSMPDEWQTSFVRLLDQFDDAFGHVPQAEGYEVHAATEHEVGDLDDAQLLSLGITEDWYGGKTPPEGLTPEDLAEWRAEHETDPTYSRDGEGVDSSECVLIRAEDPVPHYNRGRTRVQPSLTAVKEQTGQVTPERKQELAEQIDQALSKAGAFCGECGFQPGEQGCPDCVRVRGWYVEGVLPIVLAANGQAVTTS